MVLRSFPSGSSRRLIALLLTMLILVSNAVVSRSAPLTAASVRGTSAAAITAQAAGDLPFPAWWSGECDNNHFRAKTGRDAYPLGGSYRGVKACGPLGYTVIAYFGGYSGLEWQCVELVLRFMWLAYGTPGYSGNGKDIVNNYNAARGGTRLTKVANGTAGRAPRPGDVISFNTWDYTTGAVTPFGHTAIVTSANVDGNGNGSIRTLNQNSSWKSNDAERQGYLDFAVSGWRVQNRNYAGGKPAIATINWLSPEGNLPPNTPLMVTPANGAVVNSRAVTLQWQDTGDPDSGPRPTRDYALEIRKDGAADVVTIAWIKELSTVFNAGSDGVFFWRVRSGDGEVGSPWSAERSFVVKTTPCRKAEGDADCDGRIDLIDFDTFRTEFLQQRHGQRTTSAADFNQDGSVDLLDFSIFRDGYIRDRARPGFAAAATEHAVSVGEPSMLFFETTHAAVASDGAIDIDVYMENNPGTQASATDITLEYSAALLDFDSTAGSLSSPACESANANRGYLDQSPTLTNDASAGRLNATRMAVAENSSLPFGRFCVGTFRFKVKSGVAAPAMATVQLLANPALTDAAGPQAVLTPTFDDARTTVSILIGAPASIPATPTGLSIPRLADNEVTLNWVDTAANEDGYRVSRWDPVSADWQLIGWVGPNITQFTAGELPCSTAQQFRVSAFNGVGESGPTGAISIETRACGTMFLPLLRR